MSLCLQGHLTVDAWQIMVRQPLLVGLWCQAAAGASRASSENAPQRIAHFGKAIAEAQEALARERASAVDAARCVGNHLS
jgi:hypothetical protein